MRAYHVDALGFFRGGKNRFAFLQIAAHRFFEQNMFAVFQRGGDFLYFLIINFSHQLRNFQQLEMFDFRTDLTFEGNAIVECSIQPHVAISGHTDPGGFKQ